VIPLPELPYSTSALEPVMGRKSVDWHYNVLHRRYIDRVNEWAGPSDVHDLLQVVAQAQASENLDLFRAAWQAWNHDFFWHSMRPYTGAPGAIEGPLQALVKRDFGGTGQLREEFVDVGMRVFGSGWVWLVLDPASQELDLMGTPQEHNPLTEEVVPLLVCDVWEHAYYLDQGPDREAYLAQWFDMLANFDFAGDNTRTALLRLAQQRRH
jgi:Fe-Mn family superoxide dismutase